MSDIEQASGEYIDIPQEYIENACVADVGPDEIYAENYAIRNVHYPNDLEVNNMNELYLYMKLQLIEVDFVSHQLELMFG